MYTGVAADVVQRVWQHKEGIGSKFVRRYAFHRLVYLEWYDDVSDAIVREKRIKKWRRAWKIELVEKQNPDWVDLYGTLHL